MQNQKRTVIFVFLALGVILWQTLARAFVSLVALLDLPDPPVLGQQLSLSSLVAFALAILLGVLGYKNTKTYGFTSEVVMELGKVAWPSRKETQSSTVIVVITTVIIAAMLGLFDLVWSQLTGLIYGNI